MQVVAAGILQDESGRVFVQRRADGRWEFPGGKAAANETPAQTLARELKEEIGITVADADLWLTRAHPQSGVLLHFFRVNKWEGEPHGGEGQECFFAELAAPPAPMLAANILIWKWLKLPPLCAVTAAEVFGVGESMRRMKRAFDNGLRLVQLRDKNLPPQQRRAFAEQTAALAVEVGALLLINDDEQLAVEVGAHGVHLSGKKLAQTKSRPQFEWAAASCHDEKQLAAAAKLELDFAVLSPVMKTLTHVGAAPMGWDGFQSLASSAGIPVYALGGLCAEDATTARRHNGQGAAMMRRAWE